MLSLAYHLLDVFTDRPFGGNQLAVFLDAPELPDALMQRIARELNLSETVFVRPHRDGFAMRIFTPGAELPFAGHPTIGTALLLAELHGLHDTLMLHQRAGAVPVTFSGAGTARQATLTAPVAPSFGPAAPETAALARLLGVPVTRIGGGGLVPTFATAGTPFLIVPLDAVSTLGAVHLDHGEWTRTLADAWSPHLFVVAPGEAPGHWRARMFAPAMGIPEDPATGAASAAFAGVLGRAFGAGAWTVEQGVEMGRPSMIAIAADVEDGRVVRARVGGGAVRLGEGTLRLPNAMVDE